MAKVNPITGKITGKLAGTVFTVRNGVNIIREYNGRPENPKSSGQVAARAKMKLMSQLAAVTAPVIAIPKQGIVSSRNLFVKKNYPLSSYDGEQASINLNNVQLTDSVVGFPAISGTNVSGVITVSNTTGVNDIDRVVFVAFTKDTDGSLRFARSVVVTESVAGIYTGELITGATRETVVYAYGLRDNTEAARVAFGNMQAVTAEQIAKLIVTRTLLERDVTLTETVGVTIAPGA